MESFHPHARWQRLTYFWIGIASTIAYRVIILLTGWSDFWLKLAWYFGTIGFILYFAHRYQVSAHRVRLVKERDLENKVTGLTGLSEDDRAAMKYVFESLESSTEKWIYVTIFVSSIVTLLLGFYLDFLS